VEFDSYKFFIPLEDVENKQILRRSEGTTKNASCKRNPKMLEKTKPWSPTGKPLASTNIPTYAKVSVGHPPVGEVRRSTAGVSL
jgi:hypothetical protein